MIDELGGRSVVQSIPGKQPERQGQPRDQSRGEHGRREPDGQGKGSPPAQPPLAPDQCNGQGGKRAELRPHGHSAHNRDGGVRHNTNRREQRGEHRNAR